MRNYGGSFQENPYTRSVAMCIYQPTSAQRIRGLRTMEVRAEQTNASRSMGGGIRIGHPDEEMRVLHNMQE